MTEFGLALFTAAIRVSLLLVPAQTTDAGTYQLISTRPGIDRDVVFEMNNQSEKPGYGFQLAHGATSLTEAWDTRRTSSQRLATSFEGR